MAALAVVIVAGLAFLAAYFSYGRWLSGRIFQLDDDRRTPAHTERDDSDYVPTRRSVVFGHHFTSIAGTGPIVGPAIAVMWGWLPALLWVVLGSIFVGAVHDLGSLAVSLRRRGRSIGDIAGDLLGPRVRLIFLAILIVGLWIVLAIFGLVIASVLRQYPAAITPILAQMPLAVVIGFLAHRSKRSIVVPSMLTLALMYASVVFGDAGPLHEFNTFLADQPVWIWTAGLLAYCYVASVLPVWVLLQPRDYINSLQLVTSLGLITVGLVAAALVGVAPAGPAQGAPIVPETALETGAPLGETIEIHASVVSMTSGGSGQADAGVVAETAEDAGRAPLRMVAPMVNWQPAGAPPLVPLLFITVACGACSGFHCLVSSGTTSKQLDSETDAHAVGYGGMLTEGFLATLVILACAAGIGLGVSMPLETRARPRIVNTAGQWEIEVRSASVHAPGQPEMVFLTETIAPLNAVAAVPLGPRRAKLISDEEGTETVAVHVDSEGGIEVSTRVHELPDGTYEAVKPLAERRYERVYEPIDLGDAGRVRLLDGRTVQVTGSAAFATQYRSWDSAGALASTVAAFVQGAANFIAAIGIPLKVGIPLVAVMVAAFAATTLDTACRLQRYVIQELARTFLPRVDRPSCRSCAYDLSAHVPTDAAARADLVIRCPECGTEQPASEIDLQQHKARYAAAAWFNPFKWLATMHGATLLAVVSAFVLAMGPWPAPQAPQMQLPPTAPGDIPLIGQLFSQQQPTFWDQFATWIENGGKGGLILWPLFGATNQLLAGFAFVVIAAWLLIRKRPIWFLIPPGVFMLAVPAAAMTWQAFIGNEANPSWVAEGRWTLVTVAGITLVLEAWLLVEVVLRWRRGGGAAGIAEPPRSAGPISS